MPLPHGSFRRHDWLAVLDQAGLTATHFHELPHAGEPERSTCAHLRELMERMGHATTRSKTCLRLAACYREAHNSPTGPRSGLAHHRMPGAAQLVAEASADP